MRKLFHCCSCGFLSTSGTAFKRTKGVLVCDDCRDEYGKDEDVTRWTDRAVEKAASLKEQSILESSVSESTA